MNRNRWIAAAMVAGAFCATAGAQQDVTTVRVTDKVLRRDCKKVGMNLGGGPDFMKTKQVTNMEGIIRRHISYGPVAGNGYISNWWQIPEDLASEGWSYRILTGKSTGVRGKVLGRESFRYIHKGSPETKQRLRLDRTFPMRTDDFWLVEKETSDGWIDVEAALPSYAEAGQVEAIFETKDLSPKTTGKAALHIKTGPNSRRDVQCKLYTAHIDPAGPWHISFRAKSLKPDCTVRVLIDKASTRVKLTQEWQDYNVDLTEPYADKRNVVVFMRLIVGADSDVLLDDLVFEHVGDKSPTPFRDVVVNALKEYQGNGGRGGVLRYWNNQLGDSIANQVTPPLARKAHTYSINPPAVPGKQGGSGRTDPYALHEFLEICQYVGMEPWYCTPGGISEEDMKNLMEYLGGDETTPYGRIRTERGQKKPWTDVFDTIHIEIGNEAWNGIFHGGGISNETLYAQNADRIAKAMKASPYWKKGNVKFHVGVQAVNTYHWKGPLASVRHGDAFAGAPYLLHTVDDQPDLYRQALAASELCTTTTGFADMVSQTRKSNRRLEPSIYEVNYHITGKNNATEQAKNELVAGVGGAVNMANYIMLCKERLGVEDLCFFSLYQHGFRDMNGHTIRLWGTTYDMKPGSERKRPTFLALELLNRAIRGDMLQTRQSGANPTWNFTAQGKSHADLQSLANIPYLYSYAFRSPTLGSVVLINTDPDKAHAVRLEAGPVPSRADVSVLTSKKITDWNEESEVVKIRDRAVNDFRKGYTMDLPPFSLTVVRWTPTK